MTYVILVTGLSENPFSRFTQIAGIFTSLMSVAKTCTEFHQGQENRDRHIPPNIFVTVKALLFFAPHVVFRTTATAFVAAFLKFYSTIPLTVYVLISIFLNWFQYNRNTMTLTLGHMFSSCA